MNNCTTLCLWQNPARNGCSAWRESDIADIGVEANLYYTVVFVVQVIADMGILLSSCGSLVLQCLEYKLFIYKYTIANPLHPAHGSNALESVSARSTTRSLVTPLYIIHDITTLKVLRQT